MFDEKVPARSKQNNSDFCTVEVVDCQGKS